MNIRNLVELLLSCPYNKISMLLVLWLIWPGTMFVVGFIGESRIIPIGKHQSKAFFPVDLSLAVMFLALLSLHTRTYQNPEWWGYDPILVMVTVIAMSGIATIGREIDLRHYPTRAGYSPTKITHDLFGYWLIPSLLLILGLPQLVDLVIGAEESLLSWVTFAAALLFYLLCVAIDFKKGATAVDINARHTKHWHPIWSKQ